MIVTIDQHSGFCFGVTSAIRKAEEELSRDPLYCLGDIVHNGQEVHRLEQLGLETIDYDDLRTLRAGRVLLRAHGEPPSTYHIARSNGISIIDATCPVVKRLQERILTTYQAHPEVQIVIFGKIGHAEVIGLQGQTNNTALVIEQPTQTDRLDYSKDIYLYSQTTKSVEEFLQLAHTIEEHIQTMPIDQRPHFEYHDTICRNVANRVKELRRFAQEQDLVIFVGGRKSSNAKVLYHHCLEANPNTLFAENEQELPALLTAKYGPQPIPSDFRVGICGATSTPLWLMERCRDILL